MTRARAVNLNDANRRDLEMVLMGMAFAAGKDARRDLATELCAGGDASQGGLLSKETSTMMSAIGSGTVADVVEWLELRGVKLAKGSTVQTAIIERLESVAKLSKIRRLCQRLTQYEAMSAEEIAAIAELIVRSGGEPEPAATTTPEPQQELP